MTRAYANANKRKMATASANVFVTDDVVTEHLNEYWRTKDVRVACSLLKTLFDKVTCDYFSGASPIATIASQLQWKFPKVDWREALFLILVAQPSRFTSHLSHKNNQQYFDLLKERNQQLFDWFETNSTTPTHLFACELGISIWLVQMIDHFACVTRTKIADSPYRNSLTPHEQSWLELTEEERIKRYRYAFARHTTDTDRAIELGIRRRLYANFAAAHPELRPLEEAPKEHTPQEHTIHTERELDQYGSVKAYAEAKGLTVQAMYARLKRRGITARDKAPVGVREDRVRQAIAANPEIVVTGRSSRWWAQNVFFSDQKDLTLIKRALVGVGLVNAARGSQSLWIDPAKCSKELLAKKFGG